MDIAGCLKRLSLENPRLFVSYWTFGTVVEGNMVPTPDPRFTKPWVITANYAIPLAMS